MRKHFWGTLALSLVSLASAAAQPVLYLGPAPEVTTGDVSSWKGLTGTRPEIFVFGSPRTESDPSATFFLRSDNSKLFVYAEVIDSTANENELPAPLAWRNDSVEIFLGTNVMPHTRFAPGDCQIRLVPRSRSDIHALGVSVNDIIVDTQKDVTGSVVYTDKGYRILAAIPLRILHIKDLKAGQSIRCEFQLNDATTGERENLVHWKSKGDNPYYDASVWGDGVIQPMPEKQ